MPRTAKKPPVARPSEGLSNPCAVHGLLELIGRPWTLHILLALGNKGRSRFGALRRSVQGISPRVLTERLRLLERKGFILRHYKPAIPPEVTYAITSRMKDIERVFAELDRLAEKMP